LKKNKIIHVGYPRTGTTYLQRFYFPELSKNLDNDSEIISDEGLSGNVFSDDLLKPQILHNRYQDLRIIITVRSQLTIIPSLYNIYLKSGGKKKYGRYVNDIISNKKLYYYDLIAEYCRKFGSENVLVLVYEELEDNKELFLNRIQRFCGVKNEVTCDLPNKALNIRRNELQTSVTRLVNIMSMMPFSTHHEIAGGYRMKIRRYAEGLCGKSANKIFSIFQSKNSTQHKEILIKEYSEQNNLLDRKFKLSLKDYNYPGL
jgi:sulfotransferase family protein